MRNAISSVGLWPRILMVAMLSGLIATFSGCSGSGGAGGSTPSGGSIQLSPSGTAASPVDEGCYSFNIYATEANYSGNFTITMSGANGYYRLPKQTTTNGAWTISPGLICEGGSRAVTAMFNVSDQDGHNAATFVSTL
jgi:hypothetical protein